MVALTRYQLSQVYEGHEADVRGVRFYGHPSGTSGSAGSSDSLVSVSRDGSCRLWKPSDRTILVSDPKYLNCVCTVDQTVYCGSQTGDVVAVDPNHQITRLKGHTSNVCALAGKLVTNDDGTSSHMVVSASWDFSARIWIDGVCVHHLVGHSQAVWAVAIVSRELVLTAGADRTIVLWRNGKKERVFQGHEDAVRGICLVPGGKTFATCSNDTTVKLWDLESGTIIRTMVGHTSFVYAVAAISTNEIVSSGEDRSVRIWDLAGASTGSSSGPGTCTQVLTMPCVSVWAVDVDPKTEDLAVAGSDGIVRVFTRNEQKVASAELISAFDELVAATALGKDQVGTVSPDQIKDPSILSEPGNHEGAVVMVKQPSGVVEAHQWAAGVWLKVGQVVGSGAASSQSAKKIYNGKAYDYVFSVDIEDGKPPLELPFNVSENPYTAARQFIDQNQLPVSYVDQVAEFLIKNTEGVELGSAPATDPYSTGRYSGSGSGSGPSSSTPSSSAKKHPSDVKHVTTAILPYTEYTRLTTLHAEGLLAALTAANDKNRPPVLSSSDLRQIQTDLSALDSAAGGSLLKYANVIHQTWPTEDLIPALDLVRIAICYMPTIPGAAVLQLALPMLDPAFPKHALVAVRTLVNMFASDSGRKTVCSPQVAEHAVTTIKGMAESGAGTTARNISLASLVLNYSVAAKENNELLALLGQAVGPFASVFTDQESHYRLVLAMGTLISKLRALGENVKDLVAVFGLDDYVQRLVHGKTPFDGDRFKAVASDVKLLLA